MKTFRNIVIGICIFLGIYLTVDYIRLRQQIKEIRTEIVEIHDTIVNQRTDTFLLRQPVVYTQKEIKHDTVRINTVSGDSTDVILPVIQKEYQDSTYRAWVSGYQDVNLDSIQVYQKNIFTEINNTKYVTKYKNRPFSLGIQVGAQYNFMNKRPEPYVGLGVSYNIINFGKR